jgi:beta-lactamase class A
VVLAATPALPPPAIVTPAPFEVSFGQISGFVDRRTRQVELRVDGRLHAVDEPGPGGRFRFQVALPPRDLTIRVTALLKAARGGSTVVRHVFGLPQRGVARPRTSFEDAALARRLRALARGFAGTCGIYVQDLRTGAGAAWNARARFPAASTLKVAIALEVLRALRRKPAPASHIGRLLRRMLLSSDNEAANALEVWLGGSTSAGAARVNATLRALGLRDTHMYGGYEREQQARRPIPVRVDDAPAFGVGKYTTAWDFSRLLRHVHLAAAGRGLLIRRFGGSFTPSDARHLLYLLASVREYGRLDRYLPGGAVRVLHKGGWIEHARHDAGLVYWRGGAFVATVMTWNPRGVGERSFVLAGRVGRLAFDRFRR